jgi:folylpolyglutamate synthase/dihydropteroate synthase
MPIPAKAAPIPAAMKDKNLRAMTRVLFPAASSIVLTRVPYKRSATPEDLLAAAPPFRGRILLEPDTRKAVELALRESKKGICTSGTCPRPPGSQRGPAPVVIAGSLFLIGEVKRLRLFI